ncbi:hypothetical protein BG261_08575 [Floricoccus tropicus]|uniref:Uncharacterized protein n=1 Tax=Floricoccus tropicus TaxID=1859473 RepID=A0A1E8GJF7_9LACT|nr:hypothetical protein [Floricoccus tropicus]OFI48327.1 hypothetical protein BG261_08575 [Floricoccus tropicus]
MNNREKLFQEIKSTAIEWYEENDSIFKSNNINIDVLQDGKDSFVVIFDNGVSMAELVVEQAIFTPYRFVSFEVATIENDRTKISYSWYDNESTSKKELKEQLTRGITYFINI